MKIDAHVHILAPEFIRDIKSNLERDAHFKMLHEGPSARFATAETLLENMDKTGIDKRWCSVFPTWTWECAGKATTTSSMRPGATRTA